ncbi:expansin [Marchantia polymorpha subsp. ruderalis]|uniref:Expansin n=2 Tax=Marchantia polymorpha TaxID=3197 RepID=A0AAF6AYV4_MARPO|nr:hypothetical protein MARPO_0105s0025 [Marchantia polymorpha]BBN04938.1 hypothetical protein Mp_3g08920 [Marchantia polymorpha subsp. ruderalis]|eukprot:PTQ31906.1 hypothetical protein MARPO_0105s0025 [Marchantia polymorpha]
MRTMILNSTTFLISFMLLCRQSVDCIPATATFYGGNDASGTNTGACAYPNVLAMGYGTMNAALSSAIFDHGKTCGACFQLVCTYVPYGNLRCLRGRITVTATNYCPQGSKGGWCDAPRSHFDLAEPAFVQIAPYNAGVVHVDYQRVNCQRSGEIRYRLYGFTYFLQVLVYNVAGTGDVTAMSIKGSSEGRWISMTRSWGQLWTTGVVLEHQALSFMVTISDGRTITVNDVANEYWRYGQTYEGGQF